MLLLLVPVVRQDLPQVLVLRGVDALVVPVDRFQLLTERCDGAMALDRRGRERLGILVQSLTRRHDRSPPSGRVSRATEYTSQPAGSVPEGSSSHGAALVRAIFRVPRESSTAFAARPRCTRRGCGGGWRRVPPGSRRGR